MNGFGSMHLDLEELFRGVNAIFIFSPRSCNSMPGGIFCFVLDSGSSKELEPFIPKSILKSCVN